eukprot:6998872-Prorocentrum_lima.AAC.1
MAGWMTCTVNIGLKMMRRAQKVFLQRMMMPSGHSTIGLLPGLFDGSRDAGFVVHSEREKDR